MKKSTKVWLGIATGWPILYTLIFFVAIILFLISAIFGFMRRGSARMP